MSSDLEVWIARLPEYELGTPTTSPAAFAHLRDDSFVPHDECAAVLLREMPEIHKYTNGMVTARVLKANPDRDWPQPAWARRARGTRLSLLVSGNVWFEIDGVGEVSFSANDSWCVSAGVEDALLEASRDFELLEIEFEGHGASGGPASPPADEMLLLYGTYRYRSIPRFGPGVKGLAREGTGLSLSLRDDPPGGWAGCPWHLHERGVQFGYLTTGSAYIDIEGVGGIEAQPGTFWVQSAHTRAGSHFTDGKVH